MADRNGWPTGKARDMIRAGLVGAVARVDSHLADNQEFIVEVRSHALRVIAGQMGNEIMGFGESRSPKAEVTECEVPSKWWRDYSAKAYVFAPQEMRELCQALREEVLADVIDGVKAATTKSIRSLLKDEKHRWEEDAYNFARDLEAKLKGDE